MSIFTRERQVNVDRHTLAAVEKFGVYAKSAQSRTLCPGLARTNKMIKAKPRDDAALFHLQQIAPRIRRTTAYRGLVVRPRGMV